MLAVGWGLAFVSVGGPGGWLVLLQGDVAVFTSRAGLALGSEHL